MRGSMSSLPGSASGEMKLVEGLSVLCNGEMGNRSVFLLYLLIVSTSEPFL